MGSNGHCNLDVGMELVAHGCRHVRCNEFARDAVSSPRRSRSDFRNAFAGRPSRADLGAKSAGLASSKPTVAISASGCRPPARTRRWPSSMNQIASIRSLSSFGEPWRDLLVLAVEVVLAGSALLARPACAREPRGCALAARQPPPPRGAALTEIATPPGLGLEPRIVQPGAHECPNERYELARADAIRRRAPSRRRRRGRADSVPARRYPSPGGELLGRTHTLARSGQDGRLSATRLTLPVAGILRRSVRESVHAPLGEGRRMPARHVPRARAARRSSTDMTVPS